MAVFLIALAGIPPTSGFIGKFYLFWAVLEANNLIWLAVIAALNTVVSLYYYARVIKQMFLVPASAGSEGKLAVSPLYTTVLALLLVPTILFGVYWWPAWRVVSAAGMP